MSTVEELLYGLRTTDGIASDFFFLESFLSEFNDSTLLIIFFI